MIDDSGSIIQVSIDGVSYDVFADADFDITPPLYKNEGVATSGRNIIKRTKQVQEVKSVALACNGKERDQLTQIAESGTDRTLAYKTAAGDSYKATGKIDFEKWNNQESKATISMIPRTKWTFFGAS